MKSNIQDSSLTPGESLRQEFALTLPYLEFSKWNHFWPLLIAIWRCLARLRPGRIGDLDTWYDNEPHFKGVGSIWFCNVLVNDPLVLDLIDRIMRSRAMRIPDTAKARGYLTSDELSLANDDDLAALETRSLALIDKMTTEDKI